MKVLMHPVFRILNRMEMLFSGERIVPVEKQGDSGWFCNGMFVGYGDLPDPEKMVESIRSRYLLTHFIFFSSPLPSLPQRDESGLLLPGYGSMTNPLALLNLRLQDLSPNAGLCFPVEWVLAQSVLSDLNRQPASVRLTATGLMVGSVSISDDEKFLEWIAFPESVCKADKADKLKWIDNAQVLDRVRHESPDPIPLIWVDAGSRECIPPLFPFTQPVIQTRRNIRLGTGVLASLLIINGILFGIAAGIKHEASALKLPSEIHNRMNVTEKPDPSGLITSKWKPILKATNENCRFATITYQANNQLTITGFSTNETDAIRFLSTLQSSTEIQASVVSEIWSVNVLDPDEKELAGRQHYFFSFQFQRY